MNKSLLNRYNVLNTLKKKIADTMVSAILCIILLIVVFYKIGCYIYPIWNKFCQFGLKIGEKIKSNEIIISGIAFFFIAIGLFFTILYAIAMLDFNLFLQSFRIFLSFFVNLRPTAMIYVSFFKLTLFEKTHCDDGSNDERSSDNMSVCSLKSDWSDLSDPVSLNSWYEWDKNSLHNEDVDMESDNGSLSGVCSIKSKEDRLETDSVSLNNRSVWEQGFLIDEDSHSESSDHQSIGTLSSLKSEGSDLKNPVPPKDFDVWEDDCKIKERHTYRLFIDTNEELEIKEDANTPLLVADLSTEKMYVIDYPKAMATDMKNSIFVHPDFYYCFRREGHFADMKKNNPGGMLLDTLRPFLPQPLLPIEPLNLGEFKVYVGGRPTNTIFSKYPRWYDGDRFRPGWMITEDGSALVRRESIVSLNGNHEWMFKELEWLSKIDVLIGLDEDDNLKYKKITILKTVQECGLNNYRTCIANGNDPIDIFFAICNATDQYINIIEF